MDTILNRVLSQQLRASAPWGPLRPPHLTSRLAFLDQELYLYLAAQMYDKQKPPEKIPGASDST